MNMAGKIPLNADEVDCPNQTASRSALRSFGKRLRSLRQQRGLSMSQLAEKVGVSKVTVWNWEQGNSRPRDPALIAAASALDVAPSKFVMEASFGNELENASNLSSLVEQCRREIASIAGVPIDAVEIKVSFGGN